MDMEKKLYLGVDIGGTFAKLSIVDGEGNFLRITEYQVDFDGYATPILETVVRSCGLFLEEYGIAAGRLHGIGVSATGAINSVTGTVAGATGHILNWDGSQIKERMEEVFGVPTYVLNDANAAVLGEMWLGAARGRRNVVAVTIGTGIGGGIVVDSRLLLGRDGFAGEIGQMTFPVPGVRRNGEACDGGDGFWEDHASMAALVRQVRREVADGRIGGLAQEEVDGRRIFREIGKGNREMAQAVDRWMEYVTAGIVGLVYVFNPEMVILGGGVSAQEELFVGKIRQKVLAALRPEFVAGLEIVAAKLANRAGMAGAVYYAQARTEE